MARTSSLLKIIAVTNQRCATNSLFQWFSTFRSWRPTKHNITQFGDPYITIIVLKHRFWRSKSKCLRPKSGSQPSCWETLAYSINNLLAAFSPIFFCQKLQSQNLSREKLQKTLLYIKGAPKMLRKLTPIRHSPNVTNDLVFKHFQIVLFWTEK